MPKIPKKIKGGYTLDDKIINKYKYEIEKIYESIDEKDILIKEAYIQLQENKNEIIINDKKINFIKKVLKDTLHPDLKTFKNTEGSEGSKEYKKDYKEFEDAFVKLLEYKEYLEKIRREIKAEILLLKTEKNNLLNDLQRIERRGFEF